MSNIINVATSFNNNNFRNAIVMVNSLLNNYSSNEKITMYCFVTDDILNKKEEFISFLEKKEILNLQFLQSKSWKQQVENGNKILSNPVWHKLFISSELKDISKVLYISPNSLFQRDADVLLSYKYFGKIGGIIDHYAMNETIFENSNYIYYWYDTMYADLNEWRSLKFENWVIEYSNSLKINTINKENDALNIFFRKYSRALPYYFGFPVRMQTESYYNWVLSSPINISFRGEYRPWTAHQHHPYEIFWRNEYYKIFNEIPPLQKTLRNEIVIDD